MKTKHKILVLLPAVAAVALTINKHNAEITAPALDDQNRSSVRSPKSGNHDHQNCALPHRVALAMDIAENGLLWEKSADERINNRVTIPLDAKVLQNFSAWEKGAQVSLPLSSKFAPLEGVVKYTGIQADGTVITHVELAGNPTGHLMLQENMEDGFFHGQIRYDDYPVAYVLNKTGEAMDITRESIDGVICSLADHDALNVQAGLPVSPDYDRARGGNGGGGGGGKPGGGGDDGGGGGGGGGPKGKQPSVSISGASITEGDSGSAQMQFSVTLNKTSTATITVNYATANGSATAGSDYTAASGQVSFAPGETSQSVSVTVLGDTEDENDETFAVNLSNPVNAKSGTMSATGTIIDNDTVIQPSVSISGASITEGDSGSQLLQFSVGLSEASASTVTVDYATANGSATAGSDYNAASGQVSFAPGVTSQSISVTVLGDTEDENDETFAVNLSNPVNAKSGSMSATGTIIDNDTSPSNVPVLNSRPGATAVLYIDFDGEYVTNTYWNTYENNGQPIDAPGVADSYSQAKMTDIWKRVAEDYEPFDINVTTDEAVYLAAPSTLRMRCIVTPYYQWFGQAGGVAYLNSFNWSGDTPCWVFSSLLSDSSRYIAEATSHEFGHTLRLYHDGRTSPQEGYYTGHGSGATGWAPIMGVGYYQLLVQWSKGEYANANNTEDDLAIISGQNGFGYRPDDHGNSDGSATAMGGGSASGVIETRSDVDVFAITTSGGSGSISVTGASPSSNLDVLLQIYDSGGGLVASVNPADQLTASYSATFTAGTYYVRISGVGKGDPLSTGYTDYGSLGAYTVTSTLP